MQNLVDHEYYPFKWHLALVRHPLWTVSPIVCVTLNTINGVVYREVGGFGIFHQRGFKFQWSRPLSSCVKCPLDMLQIKIVVEREEFKSDVLTTRSVIRMCRELEEDVSRLKALAVGILNDMGGGGVTVPEDLVCEVCRFGAGEIHCVASIVGGIASQESIKVFNFPSPSISNVVQSTRFNLQMLRKCPVFLLCRCYVLIYALPAYSYWTTFWIVSAVDRTIYTNSGNVPL